MKKSYDERLAQAREEMNKADALLIGAGAGFSTAAGLNYGGKRFEENFPDFIKRYGLTDMYSSMFYPYESLEERWAYQSRHTKLNRYDFPVPDLYRELLALVEKKDYFVLTTNGDSLFFRSGFERDRVFATQGDYEFFQCGEPCHDTLYHNREQIHRMVEEQADCRIPTGLLPRCPRCGGPMELHLRIDGTFVQNSDWNAAQEKYGAFVEGLSGRSVVLMELGVGYNTPGIIKYPFEQYASQLGQATLIRINRDYPQVSDENRKKTLPFAEDAGEIIGYLRSGT